jgi:hypothetical protein
VGAIESSSTKTLTRRKIGSSISETDRSPAETVKQKLSPSRNAPDNQVVGGYNQSLSVEFSQQEVAALQASASFAAVASNPSFHLSILSMFEAGIVGGSMAPSCTPAPVKTQSVLKVEVSRTRSDSVGTINTERSKRLYLHVTGPGHSSAPSGSHVDVKATTWMQTPGPAYHDM